MKLKNALAGCLLAASASLAPTGLHAALLGVAPEDPKIDFGGSGVVSYDASTQILTISGIPATLIRNAPFLFGTIAGTGPDDERLFTIKLRVNSLGQFVGGIDGQPDIQVIGAVDTDFDGVAEYSGVLLEAEVTHFGSQDGASGGDDAFDLRATVTGGLLQPLYTNPHLAIAVASEVSAEFPSPFAGSFASSWTGQAKGVLGSSDPPVVASCKIDVEAYCSVNGSAFSSKCRVAQHKSPKYWDYIDRTCHGRTYKRYVYGYHGAPEPQWSRNRPHEATSVVFKYVVKNKGTTPISNIELDDSFDGDISGTPTTLQPGASFVYTRTEKLREGLDNAVLVSGLSSGSAQCTDTDTVVIREKLRERRKHDDDKYRDKGRDDDRDRR